jgi:hypothetical protein
MNRNADLLIGKLTLANDHKPIWRSALQSAGSWSQSALREVWRLPMNLEHSTFNIQPPTPKGSWMAGKYQGGLKRRTNVCAPEPTPASER